jgi:hypothetical protein
MINEDAADDPNSPFPINEGKNSKGLLLTGFEAVTHHPDFM